MSLKAQQLPIMKKILILIVLIIITFLILISSVGNTITSSRDLPSLMTTKKDLAVRGNIYSSDNFKIGTSQKIFSASIDVRCLDEEKKELFITLFSIYSNISTNEIRKKISKKSGYIIISRTINQRVAKELKSLAFKLRRLNVFKSIKVNGRTLLHGLDIYETGEQRLYPYEDTLTPVIGFMKTANSKSGKQRVNGINGLEKYFNSKLNNLQDGVLKGEKDILSYIIFNKDSKIIKRRDGEDIRLSIPLKLQRNIELMLDRYKEKFEAKEIIVSIMESDTGKILSLASSNRFNPVDIKQNEIENLSINAIEYNFEPGSVIKPLSISLAMDKNLIKPNELFFAYNEGKKNKKGEYPKGKYKIKRHTINDDHQFKKHYLTLEDIVIYSSNIGTLVIANRLSAQEFYDGYKLFGLSKKTGIDLPHEARGQIHKLYHYKAGEDKNEDNIYKTTDSYGQGITATFMQVLKAYSVFNNDGKMVTPYIVEQNKNVPFVDVISKQTANKMKKMLIKTVQVGTGKKTKIDGLEIGGKTGTANVVEKGKYQRKYMSSFFGFVNDKNKKYTIGVTVNDPVNRGKYWYYYYASHSAVPVFKEITKILLKLNYLEIDDTKVH
ncbi:MAG: penicillin-binding protein 2 [Campylobacterota bacterium]|nr:penicillin-binding protein 2 [Campylobacterota bacterium]